MSLVDARADRSHASGTNGCRSYYFVQRLPHPKQREWREKHIGFRMHGSRLAGES
jgi:hypothetical protein